MSKIVDFSKFPNITLVEEIDDMGGSSIILHFRNGASLHICPDNDVVNYTAKDDPLDEHGNHRVSFFIGMASGHHPTDERQVFVTKGKKLTVSF